MYVINTCSVTENADKQLVVKKAMKLNNKAFVAVGLLCAETGRISGS
jgi:threonylcarbamoyladenosine tRNA methylthiotransferase MtaB